MSLAGTGFRECFPFREALGSGPLLHELCLCVCLGDGSNGMLSGTSLSHGRLLMMNGMLAQGQTYPTCWPGGMAGKHPVNMENRRLIEINKGHVERHLHRRIKVNWDLEGLSANQAVDKPSATPYLIFGKLSLVKGSDSAGLPWSFRWVRPPSPSSGKVTSWLSVKSLFEEREGETGSVRVLWI